MSLGARQRRPPTPGFVANELWRRAGEVPSFHIAPARTSDARDLITGSVLGTYNSASPAWAVGPNGVLALPAANAPVIEYDPTTGTCLGARIWGVVTNDSKATEAIGGTGWVNFNGLSVSLNSTEVIDPAGGNKASKLTWGATNSQTLMTFTAAADVYSAGVWLRTLTGTANVTFYVFLQASPYTVIGTATVAVTSAWRRLSVTTSTATAAAYNFGIQLTGAGSVYAFGSQVNRGTVLGPYVQNNSTTLAASSTADVWTITGADFSRIWNQSAATMYAEATRDVVPAGDFPSVCGAYGTTFSDRIAIRYLTESIASFEVFAANIDQFICFPSVTTRTRRFAAASETDNFAASFNGAAPLIDTSGTNPTVSRISIGSNPNAQFLNGYIRELAIFRSRRPNANLQALTQ